MSSPKRGTKKYQKVLDAGCGLTRDYWGECDCSHGYDWTCDNCPINVETEYVKTEMEDEENEVSIIEVE